MKEIRFINRYAAEGLEPPKNAALISIFTPGDVPPVLKNGWEELLSLSFFDVTCETDIQYPSVSYEDITIIYNFIMKNQNRDILIIHCDAGKSRSAAIAKWAAEKCGVELTQDHPWFNPLIYRKLKEVENEVEKND